MSARLRSRLWYVAAAFALLSAGAAALLWRDGHIDHAREEVAAVLVPAGAALLCVLLASDTFDDVVKAVQTWRGKGDA